VIAWAFLSKLKSISVHHCNVDIFQINLYAATTVVRTV